MQGRQRTLSCFEWRTQLGLTQVAAGEALGRSRREIQHYEAGTEAIPRVVRLAMLYLAEHPEALETA
jgi:hypothetical protein